MNGVSEEGNIDKDQPRDKETDKFVSDNVVNIASRVLTQAEVSLLSKGLKFCPTPKELDWSAVKRAVKEFCRKIKCIKDYFEDQASYGVKELNQNFKQFKEKSSWVPNKVGPTIEVYCSKLEERLLAINTEGRNYSNLSVEEIKALRNLKNCRDIIIKEADKGSAVVVWDSKDYCRDVYRHLNDVVVHEKLQENPLSKVLDRVKKALQALLDIKAIFLVKT